MRWLAAAALGAVLASACAPAPRTEPPAPVSPPVTALSTRVEVVPGRPLVLPLSDEDAASRSLIVSLSDGRTLPATRHRVTARIGTSTGWTGEAGEWTTGEGRGAWVALIDVPADAAGYSLRVNGRALPIVCVTPPGALPAGPELWPPTMPRAAPAGLATTPRFLEASQSPRTRWRWRLMIDGLHPAAERSPAFESFEDPVVEALAAQEEHRWRAALAAVAEDDPGVADRLRRRLAGVVDFGGGEWAPVWSTDEQAEMLLRSDLLDPALPATRKRDLAERWLDRQPAAVCWWIDDGGTLDQTRSRIVSSLGIASVFDRATLAWAAGRDEPGTPDLHELPSMSAIQVGVAPRPAEGTRSGVVEVHAGHWSTSVPVSVLKTPVEPPGALMTPLWADWTMAAWQAGRPAPADWPTAVLLHRPPSGSETRAGRSAGWELFVECRLDPGGGEMAREEVRVVFGPAGRASWMLRVRPTGVLEYLPTPGMPDGGEAMLPPPATLPVSRGADRWSVRVPLPPGAVERDGLVRIGVVRTDARGRRSAWPRPMLPWQADPSRAALDTSAWGALSQPDE